MSEDRATEIVCIMDMSGSMEPQANDTIGGFNTFLQEQKSAPGEALLTVVLFNDHTYSTPIGVGTPIRSVQPLTRAVYTPTGGTPLLDSIGKALTDLDKRIRGMPAVPRTIVVIMTDGEENASHEFKRGSIRRMIKERESLGWVFLYIGANQDAFQEAEQLGLPAGNALNFTQNSQNIARVYSAMSASVGSYRLGAYRQDLHSWNAYTTGTSDQAPKVVVETANPPTPIPRWPTTPEENKPEET